MENSGEFINQSNQTITTPVEKIIENKQVSLTQQLEKIDQTRPDGQIFASVLTDIYKNYEDIDEKWRKISAINYFYLPRCANKDTITNRYINTRIKKDKSFRGSYEYKPISEALKDVPDPYELFPKIEASTKESKSISTSETLQKIVDIIKSNTDIPVVIEPFNDKEETYSQLENGNIYNHSDKTYCFGLLKKQFKSSPEILENIKNGIFPHVREDSETVGDVILINELKINNPSIIAIPLHELGHIIENNYILDKNSPTSEVISSLYELKVGLMLVEINPETSIKIVREAVVRYNWILTGTVAP